MPAPAEMRLVSQIALKLNGFPLMGGIMDELRVARVESIVHLPDMATLEFNNANFELSDEERFKVGQEIEIELGDTNGMNSVFKGEITAVDLDLSVDGETLLTVRAYDRAHRLHRGRFTRVYLQMTDSDIARRIAGELSFGTDIEATSEVHEYVLQHNQTNWEFLQERAARLGFELQVQDRTLVFKPPPSTPADPIKLTWRDELISFRASMTTSEQVNEVEVRGWDPVNKQEVTGRATRPENLPEIGISKTGGETAQEAFHKEARMVVARQPVYSQEQADAIAKAVLEDLSSVYVTAEGVAMGDSKLRLGSKVEIESVGDQFSGKYVATQVRHVYEPDNYRIEFEATGRRSTDLVSLLAPRPQLGLHLMPGIVTNVRDDPRDIGRVKVKLPLLGPDAESNWCRLVAPGAGPGRGMEYLPEVDDEVLVIGSDIDHLYVLGGLWSSVDAAPLKNSEAVSGGAVAKRVIKSRSGHFILLDDSDSGGGISIIDSTGNNKIVIDTSRNSLEATVDGDIKLHAKGKIEIKADQDITVEAGMGFSTSAGMNMSLEANSQLELKGTASASLQSNGRLAVSAPQVSLGQ